MLLIIFMDAIVKRSTSNLIKISPGYPTVSQNCQYTSTCTNCGQRWSLNHCQICPADVKRCNNFGITGHFARKCKKPKKDQTTKPPQTNVNQIDTTAEKLSMKNLLTTLQNINNLMTKSTTLITIVTQMTA